MTLHQEPESHPILIAEDSIDDACLLQLVFKRARILNPLKIVHDGEEAIEYLRGDGKYGDRKTYPQPVLFLLDLKMPRKGGMDVLRWLTEHPPEQPLPVVVIAGAGEMREVNCAYSLGARSFLLKPLNWLDLMELLSCFRELRMAAQGESYVLEPVRITMPKAMVQKPELCGYKPQPLDTTRLKLTDDILRLTELLAENNHEVWARDRMAQGWKYGTKRDDDRKEHPCLIPYHELPESEKLLDRNVALETIKTIFSFGLPYPVLEKATDTVRNEVLSKTLDILKQDYLPAEQLRAVWEEHNAVVWSQSVDLYRKGLAAALARGEALLALDIAAEGLKKNPEDLHLRQMQAVALARTGAIESANEILEKLRSTGKPDEETIALLAHTYQELWMLDTGSKRRHLKLSFELYSEGYQRSGTVSFGIHAAATGMLYGEREAARQIARQVEEMCRGRLENSQPGMEERHALLVAMAEAHLVRSDLPRAAQCYREASECAGQGYEATIRTRSRARLLLERTGHSRHELDPCFKLPRVVVCSGHMFDKPERERMRFPFGLEARVREEIRQKLAQLDVRVGYSSLACGADMLFAEAILERGGEINIVLPCHRQEFKRASVEIIPGAPLGERFDQILSKAASVTILDDSCDATGPALFEYCNRILIGNALLKSQRLGLDVVPLVVWDGREGDGQGGTQNFVQLWEQRQTAVEIIRVDRVLEALSREDTFVRQRLLAESALPPAGTKGPEPQAVEAETIKAILFAEMIGPSRLSKTQAPKFIQHFLLKVSAMLDALPKPPLVRNTWGETIHCVFDEVSEAGTFALALQELMQRTDWIALGLPGDLNMRVTLHAGPVYPCVDPVSARATVLGFHVSQATQMEPIADEGQIYATEAFATVSASHGIREYTCDYIGQKQLQRRYGTMPVFIVRRRGEPSVGLI